MADCNRSVHGGAMSRPLGKRAAAGKCVKELSPGGTHALRVQRCDSLPGEPTRFFLCLSLSKDLHVLLCGCKLLSTSQDQTLSSLFLPFYHSVPQPVSLVPSGFAAQWTRQLSP